MLASDISENYSYRDGEELFERYARNFEDDVDQIDDLDIDDLLDEDTELSVTTEDGVMYLRRHIEKMIQK